MMSSFTTYSPRQSKMSESILARCCQLWAIVIAPLLIIALAIVTIVFGLLWSQSQSSSSKQYAVEKGIIGFPITLPDDGRYVQWTFLQLNDVYEMLPLDNGRKGGLARVAYIRKLLLKENSQTYTFLAGDLISPSALMQSKVNGTTLRGRQMIATMNTLGLDFMTFGNHEFDFAEIDIISRMNESNFTWISSNVFDMKNNKSFHTSIPYKLLNIDIVRVLIIGLTTYVNKSYVQSIDQSSLISFVQKFLQSISQVQYDVLVALTHLDLDKDIELLENIPQINLIIGGHEHENYHLLRSSKYAPIYKTDANAFSVYIHRCAFNLDTRQFHIYSNLALVTSDVPDDAKTAQVANYWFALAIQSFEALGFHSNRTVSCLPPSVELDGRDASVRHFPTLLSNFSCECMVYATTDSNTTIGFFTSGSMRVDDVLRGTIIEYDILRTLPYQNNLYAISVPGEILARVLINNMLLKGDGAFLSYTGIGTTDGGKTWLINGQDISKTGVNYNIATTDFARDNVNGLKDATVNIIKFYNTTTQTQSLINYLSRKYPPC
ncbi:unnamed protein product [Rotaria sp. Silwood1]|nr:unnamed protein product [Rotaria sp. Silwood1]CAF3883639.1 unnamed protein product [Rotaria sp. Silwood1]CAF4614785.1 unnamed protein product [Rotaria sp. Silwood1]CAF4921250.1 unnamed protein product [Rotaria sp. Silwood1]